MTEARISVEPWDIFVDKIDFNYEGETYRNLFVSEVYENEPDALSLDCGVIRINPDFYILSVGGEPGINIATVLREAIPDKTLVCFGYSSSVAYVPSDKMIAEGGYEAEDSVSEYRLKGRIKLGVDKIFSDGFRCAIDEIK